jgi:hypothetical protein
MQADLDRETQQKKSDLDARNQGQQFTPGPAGTTMQPIPGSPAEREAKAAAQKEQTAEKNKKVAADIVVQDVDRVLAMAESKKDSWTPVTGPLGNALSLVPGTVPHNAYNLISTIEANSTLDRLTAMKQGAGGVGAVSDYESKMLGAAMGALKQSQTHEQFMFNLRRVKSIYVGIVHGEGGESAAGAAAPQPITTPYGTIREVR